VTILAPAYLDCSLSLIVVDKV